MPGSTPLRPSADRNLLFGILALQADLIGRDALINAMSAWTLAKSRPLGDILLERGFIDTHGRALLDALVNKSLERHGGNAEESLNSLSSVRTVCEQLQQLADPDLDVSLGHISTFRHSDDAFATQSSAVGTSTSSGLRFRILRRHAKGGLGQVSVAVDEELHREVALKEIQDEFADVPDHRSRFLREAEITGGLEHPGIVPVYGLGQYVDGRPFYAMRFIRGDNLKSAVERFHGTPFRDPGARTLELRKLLSRFLDVCNAVAYAHSRGVLHRDLKPGNIMLGPYGETLVVDWGLAKPVEHSDGMTDVPAAPLRPVTGSGADPTLMGERLGTLAYMSPEQARGELDRISPASDVYSLGATLYSVLTGQPPFTEQDPDMAANVERAQFPPPRQINRLVPSALEAICLKTMALKPEDRYPTPRALADDLEHWLADEPVLAYRELWLPRLARWARRHRPLVAGAAGLLVTAVVALAVGIVAVNREKNRTQEALDSESQARQRTREALDEMSSQVIEDWLAQRKELEPAQRAFLEKALAFYEAFAAESGNSEEVRKSVADAHARVGNIRSQLGQHEEAESAHRRSQALYESLAADFPTVPQYRLERVKRHSNLGYLLHASGRPKEAETAYRDGLAMQEQVVADFPTEAKYRSQLANCHNDLGYLLSRTGRLKEAEGAYRDGLAIQVQLTADFPTVAKYRAELARSYNNLGNLLKDTNRPKVAEVAYRDALLLQKQLVAEFPNIPGDRFELARTYNNLGVLRQTTGRAKEAEAAFRESLAIKKQLAADFPTVPRYRFELVSSYIGMTAVLHGAGRTKEAEVVCRDALAIQKQLAADFPTAPDYRQRLSICFSNLAAVLQDSGRREEAEVACRDALAIQKQLAVEFPAEPDHQNNLANTLGGLAELVRDRKDYSAARQLLVQARPHTQAALDANPRNPFYRGVFCENRQLLAATQLDLGDYASAAEAAADLARIAYEPANDLYKAAGYHARCVPLAEKDAKLSEEKRSELAQSYRDRAMEMLRQAIAKGYKDAAHMKKDTDLDALRSRDDFQKLLTELEQEGK